MAMSSGGGGANVSNDPRKDHLTSRQLIDMLTELAYQRDSMNSERSQDASPPTNPASLESRERSASQGFVKKKR